MIEFLGDGEIFNTEKRAIVIPVNTIGVMGAGLAKQLATWCPEAENIYVELCKAGKIDIGEVGWVTKCGKIVIFFPTKKHWVGMSKLEYIVDGLKSFTSLVQKQNIDSIAMPKIGCGLGGLRWYEVRTLILDALYSLPNIDEMNIEVYGD